MYSSRLVVSMLASLAVLTILAPSAYANQAPKAVAAAGVDPNSGQVLNQVTLVIGPTDTGKPLTITGSGSYDPDGDTLAYRWICTDQATGSPMFLLGAATNQVDFRPTFPPGTFDVTLTVNDGQGHTATDSVRVKVLVDLTAPTVTPPENESISATEAGGARGAASSQLHQFLFNGAEATDNSTTIFTHLPPQIGGADVNDNTLFPLGTTTVTFRIADTFGNVGTATADVFVTDLQSGDLFVGVFEDVPTAFFSDRKGVVKRIRGGSVTDFCVSPYSGGPVQIGQPVYWNRPDQIVVDSKGRVAFIAPLGFGGPFPSLQNGWGLLRCNLPGQPAEQLGIFPQPEPFQGTYMDPGWPVPLPGKTFWENSVTGALTLSGLHLRKTKFVRIDDNENNGNPQIVTEERYVLAYHESSVRGTFGSIGTLSLHTESLNWNENDLAPVGVALTPTGLQQYLPGMFYHSKTEKVSFLGLASFSAPVAKTYVGGVNTLRRILQPLEVQLTANTSTGTVQFGVQAFAGYTELPRGLFMDDVTIPNPPSGCNPPPGGRGDWPRLGGFGGSYTGLSISDNGVIFGQDSGLSIKSNTNQVGWFGHLDEALFDLDPQNDRESYFARPETGCTVDPVVDFTPLAGDAAHAYVFDSGGGLVSPRRMAASPNGLFGTHDGTPAAPGRVVQATGALDLTDVATGLNAPLGLGAFPPQVGNVQISTLIIRIDSPVDVVLSDALGRRIGVEGGQAIDEFGGQAYDSGPQTHPRLYIIRYPQPGNYTVRSIGTDTGPFKVHVYSVDSEKHVSEHISHAGEAQPGSPSTHNFDLGASGRIAFTNSVPVADAGIDVTVDAGASGTAVVALDGSYSSDPDGDTLTFTWAGPFGVLTGARPHPTLGVGVHALTLSVNDGKGGIAEANVTVTVNGIVDSVAPTTTATLNPVPNAAGWNRTLTTAAVAAADNSGGSGVKEITYSISGAQHLPSTTVAGGNISVAVAVEGVSVVTYFATDNAGNVEGLKTRAINIDVTAPLLTAPPNQRAEKTSPAGAFVAYPPPAIVEIGSGIASSACVPASGSVFPIGLTTVLCTATDQADNTGSVTFTVTVTAAENPPTQEPDGAMSGAGFINQGGKRHHMEFRVAQAGGRDHGRLAYHEQKRRFEATSIDHVIFETTDSVRFGGTGKWDGRAGYTFEGAAADAGEPGRRRDTFTLVIKDSQRNAVASVSGSLDGGNVQSKR